MAEQELISEGYTPPRIGMFYDTTALRVQNGDVPPDITTPGGKAVFYGMMADFFDVAPQGLWATIDGRPIVFLYNAGFVSAYDQSTFDHVSQHFQADFGTTPYIVRELSWEGVETGGCPTTAGFLLSGWTWDGVHMCEGCGRRSTIPTAPGW